MSNPVEEVRVYLSKPHSGTVTHGSISHHTQVGETLFVYLVERDIMLNREMGFGNWFFWEKIPYGIPKEATLRQMDKSKIEKIIGSYREYQKVSSLGAEELRKVSKPEHEKHATPAPSKTTKHLDEAKNLYNYFNRLCNEAFIA